jgi:hypothetical protein
MKLELTNEQHQWIDQWLQLWGAWCQTGKIDKASDKGDCQVLWPLNRKHHQGQYAAMMTGC